MSCIAYPTSHNALFFFINSTTPYTLQIPTTTQFVEIPSLFMDLGPKSTLQKGSRRKGKGPYIGVRLRGGRWVSEIRIPKTNSRIWLGSHHSPEKAARAYDAALYCLKGKQGLFNFPNNRRPDLANRPVGSLPNDEIQCIAAEFSCLDDSVAISEPSLMFPMRAARLSLEPPVLPDLQNTTETHLSLEPPVLPDPQNTTEMGANKVDGEPYVPTYVPEEEPYVPAYVPEEEPYVPTYVPEEPCVPAYVPEAAFMSHGNLQLDEWLALDGDWMGNFH